MKHQVYFDLSFQPMNNATPSAVLCKRKDAAGKEVIYWLLSYFGKHNGVAGQYVFTWHGGTSVATLIPTPPMNARGRLVAEIGAVWLHAFSGSTPFFIDLPGHTPVATNA